MGYTRKDYIELVDWAGRAIRDDKRGHILNDIPPILQRLHLKADAYLNHVGRKTLKTTHVKRQPFPHGGTGSGLRYCIIQGSLILSQNGAQAQNPYHKWGLPHYATR